MQERATIQNERGILFKKGGRFHTPSVFAQEALFYFLWGDEYICNEKYEVKRDSLDALSLYHIISGKMEFRYMGEQFTAEEGDVVFLDLNHAHEYRALSELRLRQYLIGGKPAVSYYEYLTSQHGYHFPSREKIAQLFQNLQQEAETEIMNEHRVSFLLHEIFGRLAIHETPSISTPVVKAQRFILRHYSEPICVESVAGHVSLSKSHLNRLFRAELSCGPHEFLLQTRLNAAKELLTETSLSIEEIGYQCGFQSATHFIRAFKKENQMTPSYFRKFFNPLS